MLDVILPAWNDPGLTWRCITHLLAFAPPFDPVRIILVNDACPTEETHAIGEFVQGAGGAYIRHEKNAGCHASWNSGMAAVESDYVLFVNNDVAVLPQCLRLLLQAAREHGLHYVSATEIQATPGGNETWTLIIAARMAQLIAPTSRGQAQLGYFNSCFLVKTAVAQKVGPFDARFRIEYGDTDWLERFRDLGQATWQHPEAWAYHQQSASRRHNRTVMQDVELCMADQTLFHEKWRHRPDVRARHPVESTDDKFAGRQRFWKYLPGKESP